MRPPRRRGRDEGRRQSSRWFPGKRRTARERRAVDLRRGAEHAQVLAEVGLVGALVQAWQWVGSAARLLGTACGQIALAKSGCFAAPAAGRRQALRAD